MKFVWAKEQIKRNTRLSFYLKIDKKCDKLKLCAVDFYQVYVDGKLISYGPSRTASGYSCLREIPLENASEILIKVSYYGKACTSCDLQSPFFGAEVFYKDNLVYQTNDFACNSLPYHRSDMPSYVPQRGFVEYFDLTKTEVKNYALEEVSAPNIIYGREDNGDYLNLSLDYVETGVFYGFDKVKDVCWDKDKDHYQELLTNDFKQYVVDTTKEGFNYDYYTLKQEHTGFITLKINAEKQTEFFVAFDEHLLDGKWILGRCDCNDLMGVKVNKGESYIISFEPYAFRHLKIIYRQGVKVTPSMITFESKKPITVAINGDKDIEKVFCAAVNTFRQNSVDIFYDCPGRERAGWLCDSFFMAKAERLLYGNNDVERAFLENIIIAKTPELPPKILPMCFPSEHPSGIYIPNWSMWFNVQIADYYKRTGDMKLPEMAKSKVYGVIEFFDKYVNEYGLLENLESWVFVEWSVSNNDEYKECVSFPSNMLYAYMLKEIGALYNDKELIIRGEKISKTILELSFNGKFFTDNAVRKDGKLVRCDNHTSETCQYYALFTGLKPNDEFVLMMKKEFGPMREDAYSNVGKSNMFIGNFLRFFWLLNEKEYEIAVKEVKKAFIKMADVTGTLWEHDRPTSSCNHGFAAAVTVIIAASLFGYSESGESRFERLVSKDGDVKLTLIEN